VQTPAIQLPPVPVQRDAVTCVHAPRLQQVPGSPHTLGEHDPPSVHVCENVPHPTWAMSVQLPVKKLQQEPKTGCGQGIVEQAALCIHVEPAGQNGCVRRVHAPVAELQHAAAAAQGFGEHAPPGVQVCAPVPQDDCGTNQHAPVMKLQQEPNRLHGLGEHATRAAQLLEFRSQSSVARNEQEAVARTQHAPTGVAHELGKHVPPDVHVCAPAPQSSCGISQQAPV
jgi:hypothetical protein